MKTVLYGVLRLVSVFHMFLHRLCAENVQKGVIAYELCFFIVFLSFRACLLVTCDAGIFFRHWSSEKRQSSS